MDGYLKTALDTAQQVVKKDWDMVFIVDGNEGSGKSWLAIQAAYYCDPTLTLDRVAFTPKEFRTCVMRADKYQSVIYDEAFTGLSSRATMTYINRTLVNMLAEIRQKNLFVFIVMPTFFDLDRYAALWRSRGLIHVYTGQGFKRGYFAFYNTDRKKHLYIEGKKYYSYYKPKPNFIGRFTNTIPIDEEAYRKKKLDSLTAREQLGNLEGDFLDIKRQLFPRALKYSHKLMKKEIADILGISVVTFRTWMRNLKDAGDAPPDKTLEERKKGEYSALSVMKT